MNTTKSYIIACLWALSLVGCAKKEDAQTAGDVLNRRPNQSRGYFKTHFQDESQFIVEAIVTDLAEMASYAKSRKLPDPKHFSVAAKETWDSPLGAPVYDVETTFASKQAPLKIQVSVQLPIWAPEPYEAVAKRMLDYLGASLNVHRGFDSEDTSTLVTLTEPTAHNIETENQVVSKELAADFTNPTLHEKAALILGAFALRENSGDFFEIRSPLCRMTAHLALARKLSENKEYGVNGLVAEAMLYTLMNNQKAALEKVDQLEQRPAGPSIWARALRARLTGDYRRLAEAKNASLLEKTAWFSALGRSVDVDAAWEKLPDDDKTKIPDFCRIANAEGYAVGTGQALLQLGLPLEFAELEEVHSLSRGLKLDRKKLVQELNRIPDRCFQIMPGGAPVVRVIGWGQWAAFCQRHLCHAVRQNFDFLNRKWGVREEAATFAAKCNEMFAGLRLYPFVQRFNSTEEKTYHKSVEEGFAVTVATPHLVPAQCWNYLTFEVGFAKLYVPVTNPHVNEWHKHNPPPGTVYDLSARIYHPSLYQGQAVNRLEKLHVLAPYDSHISQNLIRVKYNNQPTAEQAAEVYRPVLDYSARQMYQLALRLTSNPPEYERLMLKAAAVRPTYYLTLGNFFARRGDEEKGATYLEKGIELGDEPVTASNSAGWLVKYYQRKGQLAKAEKLADMAAEVYSYAGLLAKAELLESTGKYAEALDYYLKIEERYDRPGDVITFCLRYQGKTGDNRYNKEIEKRLKALFPRGIEKVTKRDFKGPPRGGVIIRNESELLLQSGLRKGDIIVALNGVRVYDLFQYEYIREKSTDPKMDFVIARENDYLEVQASPPDHKFGVNLSTVSGR